MVDNQQYNNNVTNSASNGTKGFFTPENTRNPELGVQIRQQIDILASQFIELDDKEKSILRDKKSIILEIADKFERLYEIGEYPFPINNICSSIYKYLQRKGYNISDTYVQIIIKENAPQYLNHSYQRDNTCPIDIKLQQDEILKAVQVLKNIKPELMTNGQLQDIHPALHESLDTIEFHCDKNQILLQDRHEELTTPHYAVQDLDPFSEHIETDKPDPREIPSNLAIATMDLGETLQDCGRTIYATGKMMESYPPDLDDQEMEVHAARRVWEWKEFWRLVTQALKGGTDRKYRRSVLQWQKIADDEADYGKHAASSKNPYIARYKDKDGNWTEEVRKLTREQIGEKAPKARELGLLFKKSVPACFDFLKWSENYLHQYTNALSVKLHDKLSDRSLR